MPTRKQRRRREKERRHEWEYVYVDDEGREVEVEEDEPAPAKAKAETRSAKQPARAGAKTSGGRAARKVDPPSWNRVFKRTAIIAPVMFIFIYYVGKSGQNGRSAPVAIYYTAVMLVVFIPFTYMVDQMMYRAYRKRIGDPLPPRERKPKRS